jgi:hypothetical protein
MRIPLTRARGRWQGERLTLALLTLLAAPLAACGSGEDAGASDELAGDVPSAETRADGAEDAEGAEGRAAPSEAGADADQEGALESACYRGDQAACDQLGH